MKNTLKVILILSLLLNLSPQIHSLNLKKIKLPTSPQKVYENTTAKASEARPILWKRVPDVAQYKFADTGKTWSNEVSRANNITLWDALEIAEKDPKITYFFFVKGGNMYLEADRTHQAKGNFAHGDVVFFHGKPWYGSAPGLADAYEKN